MAIKGLRRFDDDSSCCHFVVFNCAPVLPDPDEGSGPMTYESPSSSYFDLPKMEKAKTGWFVNDSVVTGFWYRSGDPTLKHRSVEWKDTVEPLCI